MEKGYYGDYDDFTIQSTEDNLVGYGIKESNPVDVFGKIVYNTGDDRLVQCMVDILVTSEGSRFMNPSYGSKLYKVLEEPNDFVAKDMAEMYTQDAIERWEPRVVLIGVEAEIPEKQPNVLRIRISYHMKNSNEVNSFVYSFNRKVPEMR